MALRYVMLEKDEEGRTAYALAENALDELGVEKIGKFVGLYAQGGPGGEGISDEDDPNDPIVIDSD